MRTTNVYLENQVKQRIREMVNKIGPGASLIMIVAFGDKRRVIFDKMDMVNALYKIAKLK